MILIPLDFYNSKKPKELNKVHKENDKAVMETYGFFIFIEMTESECVAYSFFRKHLFLLK